MYSSSWKEYATETIGRIARALGVDVTEIIEDIEQ